MPVVGTTTPHETDTESGSIENGAKRHVLTYRVTTIDEAETYGPSKYRGCPLVKRSWDLLTGELGYSLTLEYDGAVDPEKGVVELDVSFSEKPIEQHPNIKKIMEFYLGTLDEETQEVKFKPELTRGTPSGLAAGANPNRNPMFGVKTYLVLSAVVRHTLVESRPPRLSRIGSVVKSVPVYDTPKDHDWLCMPPRSRTVGENEFENTYEFMMSEKGGWPAHLHGFIIQL